MLFSFLIAASTIQPITKTIIPPTAVLQGTSPNTQIYYELTPRRKAILDTIAYTEGLDRRIDKTSTGYNYSFAYIPFTPGKTHPYKTICSPSICSSAAGRYQILDVTYNWLQSHLKLNGLSPFPAFTPIYQDQMALYLIDAKRHALGLIDNGSINQALDILSYEWASIAPGRYGQPTLSRQQTLKIYYQFLQLHQTK